jgi:hypothetical protein
VPTSKNSSIVELSAEAAAQPHLISKRELAKRYSVSTRTIQNWIARRIIPYIRMGGDQYGRGGHMLRFNPQACDAALKRFGWVEELSVSRVRAVRRKPAPRISPKPIFSSPLQGKVVKRAPDGSLKPITG